MHRRRSLEPVGFNRVMGRVVLATMGSWGDIFPAIGLAKGLIEAGHDARIAASPAYDELVRGEGLDFSGIGPPLGFSDYAQDPKILSGRLGGFAGFAYLFRRFIFPVLDRIGHCLRIRLVGLLTPGIRVSLDVEQSKIIGLQ